MALARIDPGLRVGADVFRQEDEAGDEDEAEKLNRPTAFPGPAQLRQRLGFPGNLIEALKACRETESRPWKSGASESAHSRMSA